MARYSEKNDERPRLESQLDGDLRTLRERGVASGEIGELEALLKAARTLSDAPSDQEKVAELLADAIRNRQGRYKAKYSEKTINLWFGLDPETWGERPGIRLARAYAHHDEGDEESLRTHGAKRLSRELANYIYSRYIAATAQTASSEPSPPPRLAREAQPEKPNPQSRKQRNNRSRKLEILAVVLTLLVVGWLGSAGRFSSDADTPSLSRLAAESKRQLRLGETPAPGATSRQLGFGDAVGGRQTFPYSGATTTTWEPTFNSIVDTPYAPWGGDERLFTWLDSAASEINEKDTGPHRQRSRHLSGDDAVSALVLVENSAAPQPNCNRLQGVTIAENSRLRAGVWNSSNGKLHVIRVWLFANNTNPRWVTDAVAVTTDESVDLDLDPRVSYVYSQKPAGFADKPQLGSKAVLNPAGMLIGHGERGLIGSCWDNRFFVVLVFRQKSLA